MTKPGGKSKKRQKISDETHQKVSFFMERKLWKKLGLIALNEETTRTELIHQAIKDWLNNKR